MSITDELRHEVANYPFRDNRDFALFEAIADRIDAEHERMFDDLTVDMQPMTDESMAEHGWMRLPVDADGEYIHIADVMCWLNEDVPNKVDCMHLCGDGWWVYSHGVGVRSKELRHYHATTVEDVLREFVQEFIDFATCIDDHEVTDAIEQYAKRLKLAEGEGE